ncbi:MAG TPA: (2Fe-2S)-binding protein [Lachnospiraceae bacterium]|nr:(2Fe-2S)-binding protein [Lachnospiraceae bacterium]
MELHFILNGKPADALIKADTILLDLLREKGCYSVKRGCDTSGCGLCTVLINGVPSLSCSVLAARVEGKQVTTLEGMEREAAVFGEFLTAEGAEQCGYCTPGLIMNILAMEKELNHPSEEEVKEYLAGNLCRCSGYMGQMRAIMKYLNRAEGGDDSEACQ